MPISIQFSVQIVASYCNYRINSSEWGQNKTCGRWLKKGAVFLSLTNPWRIYLPAIVRLTERESERERKRLSKSERPTTKQRGVNEATSMNLVQCQYSIEWGWIG